MDLTFDWSVFTKMLTVWDVLLVGLIWLCLHVTQERFSDVFAKPRVGWRILPFMPVVMCVPCMFVSGPWFASDVQPGVVERVLLGILLGIVAYNFGGVANRLGLVKIVNAAGITWIVDKTTPKSEDPSPPPPAA